MFLKRYHWTVAYRKNKDDNFKIIPNPSWGWCADPFLVEYNSEIYIFAEAFLYKSERKGVIVYCKYNGESFTDWTVSMDKHWHLSYPNVFVINNELYLCPESYQNETISLYKLEKLPDKWTRIKVLLDNVKYVDSTFLLYNGNNYMFTFAPKFKNAEGELLLYKKENDCYRKVTVITTDKKKARPAGNFIIEGGKMFRVAQISGHTYGEGIVFLEIDELSSNYKEHEIKKIYPSDIPIENNKKYCGIHTYNQYNEFEVIDLKYKLFSFSEWIARKRIRKVFVEKY